MPLWYDGTLPPSSIPAQLQLDPLVEVEAVEQFRHDVHVPGAKRAARAARREACTYRTGVRRLEG